MKNTGNNLQAAKTKRAKILTDPQATKSSMHAYIDSHAHLSMLINEKGIPLDTVIQELGDNNVKTVINICENSSETDFSFNLEHPFNLKGLSLFHAAGVHPHKADNSMDSSIINYNWIRNVSEKLIAVGEVGLDFYYNFSSCKSQKKVFRNMIELSIELKKPLIVHGRSAESQAVEIIKEYGDKTGNILFHCYTGDMKTACQIVERGWFISFSGILTFKKSTYFHDILKQIGIDQVIFETDSPFLAPAPFRGKVNTPAKVAYIYEFVSDLMSIEKSELAKTVKNNCMRFFEKSL